MPKYHENILKNNQSNWFQNVDFNERYGIEPGDFVVLRGKYGDVDFKKINGVTFVNDGPVEMASMTIYPGGGAQDICVLGNQTSGLKYGIQFKGNRFALNFGSVGKMEFKGLATDGNQVGFKIVGAQGVVYPINEVDLLIEDCMIENCRLEAMYIGADHLTGPWIKGRIIRNIVRNAGWDAIQCRVGEFEILENDCDNIGIEGAPGQDHGILIGGNTKNSKIIGNILRRVRGYGIFNNGFGDQEISCNDIECGGDGFQVNNYGAKTDTQKVGYQHFIIHDNYIKPGSGLAGRGYSNNPMPISITYTNNRTSGKISIHKDIKLVESGNGPDTITQCGATEPPPPPVFNNAEISRSFTKSCPDGQTGSEVIYTVPAGKYQAETQHEADQLALQDITENGPSYADANGACTIEPPKVVQTIKLFDNGTYEIE